MSTSWGNALWEAAVDFVIDVCTIVPAAFIGLGLVLNEGKNVMGYFVLGLPFLAIAFVSDTGPHALSDMRRPWVD